MTSTPEEQEARLAAAHALATRWRRRAVKARDVGPNPPIGLEYRAEEVARTYERFADALDAALATPAPAEALDWQEQDARFLGHVRQGGGTLPPRFTLPSGQVVDYTEPLTT